MVKVIIVDDEPQSVLRLQSDLRQFGDFDVIATSSSPLSAKTLVTSMQPDVLFLDVEMPGQTGFEVLQSIREEMPEGLVVVFYSAFDKYMIEALRASAFDFLLKPYLQEELGLVVTRVREKVGNKEPLSDMQPSLAPSVKRTAIQTISGLLMVTPKDVFSCIFDEDSRLWNLRMVDGKTYKLRRQTTAKTILSISSSFVQVRQDSIVNLDYLVSIENFTLRCIFAPPFDQEEMLVSRRCYKAVKEQLEIL